MADDPAAAGRDAAQRAMQDFAAASQRLNVWMAGEQALALLRAAHAAGILDALLEPRTAGQVAAVTGLDGGRVADVLLALDAQGIAARDGETYRLAADIAHLAAPTAFQPLPGLIARSAMLARAVESSVAADHTYTQVAAADAVALAKAAAPNPLSPTFVAYTALAVARLPALRARWEAGARHIEFGCGAGGTLLSVVAAHPHLTAVGVEINAAILPETRRRAAALGIADRVTVRQGDARDGAEEAAYHSAFWAQQFFATADRPTMLAALGRTLMPGGFLLVPTFTPGEPGDDAALHSLPGQGYALNRLRFRQWGVPPLTPDELRAEAEAAGFAYVDRTPFTSFFLLLFRRP